MEDKIICKDESNGMVVDYARLIHMYNVILCDDDLLFLTEIKKQVANIASQIQIQVKIYAFGAMEQISDHMLKTCDIAILDIDFAGKKYCGIDIARRLRLFRNDSIIMFLTNYIDFAPEGYEVQAFRYILKSNVSQKLAPYISSAVDHLNKSSETIKFQINGEIVDILLDNIIYIESQLHLVNVFVLQSNKKIKAYTFYGSIGKLEQHLSAKGFLRIHKSYLVNMSHIQRYQCQKVELANGIELKASASRYAEQKERYLLWKGDIYNG